MIRNYRSQLPFGDEALAQIRKDVLTQIEREQRVERRWLGLFLRATLAASVLVFLVSLPLLRNRPDQKPTETRTVSPRPQPPAQLATRNSQPESPVPSAPSQPPRRPRRTRRAEPPASEVVRIELHTSDPDVRIIWFTNHTGETR